MTPRRARCEPGGRFRHRRAAGAVLLTVATVGIVRDAAAQTCSGHEPVFREILDEFQSRQRNVGLAAAVMVDGRLAFAEAFGWADRERERPATVDTRFGVASLTKAFTGLALLRLATEGRIDLDAAVQRYVPEFPRHPAGPVTIRHIAAQLAGIRHWGPERDTLFDRRFADVEDILPLFVRDPWAQAPGVGYSYSSYAYNLLAIALQRGTGERFQDLVRTRVIEALGLESVAFDAPGFGGALRAARYSYYDLEDYHELEEPVRVPDRDYTHNMAGGNMVADIVDLVRLGEAVRRPGFLTDVEHETLWARPVIDGVESPMSFGWFVREGGNRIASSGSNPGLQAGLAVWRDEAVVVAVVANSWGIGSRSAELVDDGPDGLLGRLAAVCRRAPPARAHHRLVSLPDGGVGLIGGSTRTDSGYVWFDDMWRWRQDRWVREGSLPFERSSHAVAFDGARSELVLVGGIDREGIVDGALWTGGEGRWERRAGLQGDGWGEPAACYDPVRERVVIFGGWDRDSGFRGDTWEWDGRTLSRVASRGPPARAGHGMAFDPVGGRCLLFGGRGEEGLLGDTWSWDGREWRWIAAPGPTPRWFFGMTTATEWDRVILFGGAGEGDRGDTWEWDGAGWRRIDVAGPPARGMSRIAFDGTHVVLFGGRQARSGRPNFVDLNDTWLFDGERWTPAYRPPTGAPSP